MKSILLTGGAGYIGSHSCLELLKNNYKITILDSLVNSSQKNISRIIKILENDIPNVRNNIEFYEGDIRDFKFLEKIFLKKKLSGNYFDGVIHFCGLKSVNDSFINPIEYWDVNVLGTINLIKVMKIFNCNTLVFSSSATVYGKSNVNPIKENTPLNPLNTYGYTKATIERILSDLYAEKLDKFRIAILRYFNPVGAHESGLIGELPLGTPNNIFPLLNQVAYRQKEKFKIFGNDWETRDGTCIRDYIHIMDLANGHLKALDYLLNNSTQIIRVNLGTAIGTSVLDLIKTFQEVNKVNFPIEFIGRREGDTAIAIADNSLAKEILNWTPKKTIQDMCMDGFNWHKSINKS
tara:strand:+ start:111 stop:1160 length:1050 start_codon:yes stop_codon:yes gene_type:complete